MDTLFIFKYIKHIITIMKYALLILGSLLPLVGTVIYIRSILKLESRPQRMTKFLLTLITGMSFVALLVGNDNSGVWLALSSFVQCFIIFFLSFKYGLGGFEKFDVFCLLLCLAGLITWAITGESHVGLVAAIFADLVGIAPALVKTWRLPYTEIWIFYAIDALASLLVIISGDIGLGSAIYPLYLFLANAAFVWIILFRRKQVEI